MKFQYNNVLICYNYFTQKAEYIVISQYTKNIAYISFRMSAVHALQNNSVGFGVTTAVTMKSTTILWDVMPCSLVVYWCLGGMYCLHLHSSKYAKQDIILSFSLFLPEKYCIPEGGCHFP
jgi:hypothetical protein